MLGNKYIYHNDTCGLFGSRCCFSSDCCQSQRSQNCCTGCSWKDICCLQYICCVCICLGKLYSCCAAIKCGFREVPTHIYHISEPQNKIQNAQEHIRNQQIPIQSQRIGTVTELKDKKEIEIPMDKVGQLILNERIPFFCCFECPCSCYNYQTTIKTQKSKSFVPCFNYLCCKQYQVESFGENKIGKISNHCCTHLSLVDAKNIQVYQIKPSKFCQGLSKTWNVLSMENQEKITQIHRTGFPCCGCETIEFNLPPKASYQHKKLLLNSVPYLP